MSHFRFVLFVVFLASLGTTRADEASELANYDEKTLQEAGVGGRSNSDRLRWIRFRRVSCHEVAPSTPSTR